MDHRENFVVGFVSEVFFQNQPRVACGSLGANVFAWLRHIESGLLPRSGVATIRRMGDSGWKSRNGPEARPPSNTIILTKKSISFRPAKNARRDCWIAPSEMSLKSPRRFRYNPPCFSHRRSSSTRRMAAAGREAGGRLTAIPIFRFIPGRPRELSFFARLQKGTTQGERLERSQL